MGDMTGENKIQLNETLAPNVIASSIVSDSGALL